jgi:hypothetical protein
MSPLVEDVDEEQSVEDKAEMRSARQARPARRLP